MEINITDVEDSYQTTRHNGLRHLLNHHSTHSQRLLWAQGDGPSISASESYAETLIEFEESSSATPESAQSTTRVTNHFEMPELEQSDGQQKTTRVDSHVAEDNSYGSNDELSNPSSAQGTEKPEPSADDFDLESEFGFGDFEDFLERYMALKLLQRKTVMFAKATLDREPTDEETKSDNGDEEDEPEEEDNEAELEVLTLRDVHGEFWHLPFEDARTWEVSFSLAALN